MAEVTGTGRGGSDRQRWQGQGQAEVLSGVVPCVPRGSRGCGSALRMPQECSGVLFGKFDSQRVLVM